MKRSLLSLGLLLLCCALSCKRSPPPNVIDRDPVQAAYSPEFLAGASHVPGKPARPGRREVRIPSGSPGPKQFVVTLDTSRQRLGIDVPQDLSDGEGEAATEVLLHPSVAAAGLASGRLVSAAALGLKAKQFDDGLYAAVELAADAGLGTMPSRKKLLQDVLAAAAKGPWQGDQLTGPAVLAAAAQLGGIAAEIPDSVRSRSETLQKEFLANALRSTPLGFYTWSEDYVRIFQRDRMLQTELGKGGAHALSQTLGDHPLLLDGYQSMVRLAARLTNPLARPDLGPAARARMSGAAFELTGQEAFLPPSRAYETDLIKRLYGEGPIPDGFDLADEMVERIRAGRLDLTPRPESGWYDHQTFALETLAAPDRAPEGPHLRLTEAYRKELVGLFKSLLALTRETHVKQLEIPLAGAGAPSPQLVLQVVPDLSVEPTATYYLRRARSYRFVRTVLEDALGRDAWKSMRRMTAAGPINMDLGDELTLVQSLFYGAYVQSCLQIGMTPEFDPSLGGEAGAWASRELFSVWARTAGQDPDLARDVRMMVPVFFDRERGKMKVWAVLGVATKPLQVWYDKRPAVLGVETDSGEAVEPERARVVFVGESHQLAYLVSAELYVSVPMNRTEFRALCDKHKTQKAILDALN